MKQYITNQQLEELSEKGEKKLLDWWNALDPKVCPRCGSETAERDRGADSYDDDIAYTSYVCPCCKATYHGWFDKWQNEDEDDNSDNQLPPLLSIGQTIQFLNDNGWYALTMKQLISKGNRWWVEFSNSAGLLVVLEHGKNVVGNTGTDFHVELVDALWECVKQVLEA